MLKTCWRTQYLSFRSVKYILNWLTVCLQHDRKKYQFNPYQKVKCQLLTTLSRFVINTQQTNKNKPFQDLLQKKNMFFKVHQSIN